MTPGDGGNGGGTGEGLIYASCVGKPNPPPPENQTQPGKEDGAKNGTLPTIHLDA